MKKYSLYFYFAVSFIYYEIVFKIINNLSLLSLSSIVTICFSLFLASLVSLGLNFLNKKLKIVFGLIALLIPSVYFSAHICLFNFYKFYFQFSSLALLDQVAAFAGDGISVILNNLKYILLMFVPFIGYIIFSIFGLYEERFNFRVPLISLLTSTIVYLVILFLPITDMSLLSQTYMSGNFITIVNKLGGFNGFFYDGYSVIFGKNESLIDETDVEETPQEIVYKYNTLDIDFSSLNNKTDNSSIQELNNYFANKQGSKQNEYTGYFKDKNLILFMAESFNGIVINKDLTPTLYKLVHDGFDFTNFYTPTIYSTIGGEYCELTGLYPDMSGYPNSLSLFRDGSVSFPMGIGNIFKSQGYKTYAYHNSDYDFQDRNVYIPNMGFDSFTACGLGIEKYVDCSNWPKSDIEMIDGSFADYINDEKFLVFYASVSGHGGYSFTNDNDIAPKYEKIVKEYYGDKFGNGSKAEMLMSYVAGQMELDRALELLLNKLAEAQKLDDTVIALVGDHHPYYLTDHLSIDEYNELSTYYRDSEIELYHSNFILYNSQMEPTVIDSVGGQMDVIPTIYNLFEMPYDSRLFVGNDILSTSDCLAVTGDGSFVCDYGKYYSSSDTFELKDGVVISDSLINALKNKTKNIQKISRMIMKNNYYKFVFDNN